MAGRTKKAQITVYLEPDVMDLLAQYAAQRDQSMSLIAQAAIASFLSPDSAERQEAALARRLGQIDRRLARLERDLGISTEAFATFIRFWLATTPALPEPAAQATRAKLSERYAAYTRALGRRLAKGPQPRQEIVENVGGSEKEGSNWS
ncbi:CopG family transcriptional regulator [Ancylobacter defluvii]|uniref:CopG family transcriptional regulator n=1 Tax=Ancylobacter defluvii TaxID=1282440 RepID=A0A9W6NCU4_9HYPH|nr:CopG family transcriptional regulator [Ancylobacter defluvii]MBS7586636.1 CopG family transcriptional regulator [Ancylobacter defluvii]GLK85931.1 CopG family transcriptional regulator [Ancylobacter defluvii]